MWQDPMLPPPHQYPQPVFPLALLASDEKQIVVVYQRIFEGVQSLHQLMVHLQFERILHVTLGLMSRHQDD